MVNGSAGYKQFAVPNFFYPDNCARYRSHITYNFVTILLLAYRNFAQL